MDAIEKLNLKLKDFNLDNEYTIISKDKNSITLKHEKCGFIFSTKEVEFFNKNRRCLKCLVSQETNNEFSVIEKTNDSRSTYIIEHSCGLRFKRSFSEYERRGCSCYKCSEFKHYTHESFTERVKSLTSEYEILSTFKNCSEKIKFRHVICDSVFDMSPSHFLDGRRCPICKNNNLCKTDEYFKKELSFYFNNEISSNDTYSGLYESMEFIHIPCGHRFIRKPSDLLQSGKKGVFKCDNCMQTSHGEFLIEKYLTENNVDFKKQFTFDDCVLKRKLKFDFAIFKQNILFCLIEFDGRQHYYGYNDNSENLLETQQRDTIKNSYCEKNNIKLFRIPYTEIQNIDSLLKSFNIY